MKDAKEGELSPGQKSRKRVHEEIASGSRDSNAAIKDQENRPPSRAANGEPLEKKLRETPSPEREAGKKSMSEEIYYDEPFFVAKSSTDIDAQTGNNVIKKASPPGRVSNSSRPKKSNVRKRKRESSPASLCTPGPTCKIAGSRRRGKFERSIDAVDSYNRSLTDSRATGKDRGTPELEEAEAPSKKVESED